VEGTPKGKLLIVDDAKLFLRSFRRLLCKEGYDVTTAENGSEALEHLKKETFDLVVTDIEMPKMNGIDMLKRIKTLKGDLMVIVLTAFSSLERKEEALKFGASGYIEKPVEIDYIKGVIGKLLKDAG